MKQLVKTLLAATAAVLLLSLAGAPGGARAQGGNGAQGGDGARAAEGASPEEARAQQFQRVEGPQTEQIAAAPLLLGAYATIWILLFGYLFVIARRQASTRAELERLEKLVAAQAQAQAQAAAAPARPAERSSLATAPAGEPGDAETARSASDAAGGEEAGTP